MPSTHDRRAEPRAPHGGGALLQLEGVAKRFPNGTEALKDIDFSVAAGSVHGLVGSNGAGKSTAIKIVSGALAPSAGTIRWDGEPTQWRRPADAGHAGIATVHQHIPLVPTLPVLENVFLGRSGRLRRRVPLERELDALLARIDYHVDAHAVVGELSIGERQMVAILQALATGARLIIMDEPTASLAVEERRLVFRAVRRLSAEGTAVLYISHFLDEILSLTDHVTVLRDGRVVADSATTAWDEERLVTAIVGERLAAAERAVEATSHAGDVVLRATGVRIFPHAESTALTLRAGEVVGVAGLLGSGRSELLHALFRDGDGAGTVVVGGRPLGRGARSAAAAGIALVPEDRTAQGLLPGWEIWRNVTLPALTRFARHGLLDNERERARGRQALAELGVVAPDEDVAVSDLSGGNAQKVVFAKWVLDRPRVLLLDEPMAGIDVGAKRDLFDVIRRLAADGTAVLLASSDFEELLAVCARIVVLHRGTIVTERRAEQTTPQELVALASGLSTTPSLTSGATP